MTEGTSKAEKREQLYLRQKELLDTFLAHRAISPAQYEKSLGDLTAKMGMEGLRKSQKKMEKSE